MNGKQWYNFEFFSHKWNNFTYQNDSHEITNVDARCYIKIYHKNVKVKTDYWKKKKNNKPANG